MPCLIQLFFEKFQREIFRKKIKGIKQAYNAALRKLRNNDYIIHFEYLKSKWASHYIGKKWNIYKFKNILLYTY